MEHASLFHVYRDGHLLVVDKPPGISVQPDRTGDVSLLQSWQAQGAEGQLGSPHRLDRPVSGLVVFTRSPEALKGMAALFRDRQVEKHYLAIVEGKMQGTGELEHRLRHAGGTRKAEVGEVKPSGSPRAGKGRVARLRYAVLAEGDRYTLLEVVPHGGAFHQIRAQLAAVGHPIKGDVKYGARRGERDRSIALHAWKLRFNHPVTKIPLDLQAKVPAHSLWPVLGAGLGQ